MKTSSFISGLALIVLGQTLLGQTNQTKRLFFPFLDEESQSNVVVHISDPFGDGQPCPWRFTNVLSNSNLFTPAEQKTISEIFVKYKNATTNSGPPGTVFDSVYKTNYVIKAWKATANVENWVANYHYTNSDAREKITYGAGMMAEFRNKLDDGYNASFTCTGDGTLLNFWEIKHGLPNGILSRFADCHGQGPNWDYRLANFTNSHLTEYMQYTNGMVMGRVLSWNALTGRLLVDAEFNEPYDMKKHRIDFQSLTEH